MFKGFPKESVVFLHELAQNNNREWFAEHRQDYERYYLAPSMLFVEDMGKELVKLVDGLVYQPRVNGSIFRINRDTRFSKGKAPYKTHIGLLWWKGAYASRTDNPGFYFQLEADSMMLGAGSWWFGDRVGGYREALKGKAGEKLAKIVQKLPPDVRLEGDRLQKYARGFKDHPMMELSRYKGLYAEHKDDFGLPDIVHSPELVDYCLAFFRKSIPLVEWLIELSFSESNKV
jgi:uncharacterized protein (TIGR02453 family)